MALVAVSWVYILFAVLTLGTAMAALFGIQRKKFVETAFLGLFATTIIASFWAFFGRINIEFHIFLLAFCGICFFRFRQDFTGILASSRDKFSELSPVLKVLLLTTAFIVLGQSAAAPFVLDNESYYIQMVKWLNEHGFVKGLANLHLFLAQTSGWHIAQSAFSFSFLYDDFNDLSGLCLLLGNIYAFFRLDDFLKSGDKIALAIGLFPILNVFLLRFSGAPSPDIPVYVISFVVFDYFVRCFKNPNRSDFNFIVIMVLFIVYCKVASIALVFLPLAILIQSRSRLVEWKIVVFALVVLGLFIGKNYITSGHPFFPLPYFAINGDFALPRSIVDWSYEEGRAYGYRLTTADYDALAFPQLIIHWLTLPKLHGFFNCVSSILILIAPIFIWKFINKKAIWVLYFTMVLQLALLLHGSPQYRYFLNFTMFFSLLALACLPLSRKLPTGFIGVSLGASMALLIVPIPLESFTQNRNLGQTSAFRLKNLVVPHENSRLGVSFQTVRKGNLIYNSPVNPPLFWATGNGNLPCVNQEQIEYFEYYHHYYPQLRTDNLKDGFYAKPK